MGNILGKFSLFSEIFIDELKNIIELILADWRDDYYLSQQINKDFQSIAAVQIERCEAENDFDFILGKEE